MTAYQSTASLGQIARRIADARHVALLTHNKPDGDAAGATLALARALELMGKRGDIIWMGPVEPSLRTLAGPTPVRIIDEKRPVDLGDEYDLIVIVDTGAWTQLEPLVAWLQARRTGIVGVDHHVHGEDVASMRYVDTAAASTTHNVARLVEEMGLTLGADSPGMGGTGGVAEALFVGLATDTGWFRYVNTTAAAFALAAKLIECGVDHARLFQLMEETQRPARLALEARALASVQYVLDGAVAIMCLGPEDFRATGGAMEDLTHLVNAPMVVQSVRVSVLLAQNEPGRTKVSVRSKPRTGPDDRQLMLDANLFCQQFNGGGHTLAAGARIEADLPQARARLIAALDNNAVRSR